MSLVGYLYLNNMMGELTNEELQREYERLAKLILDKMSALKIIPEEDLAMVYKDLSDIEQKRSSIKSKLENGDSNS